MWMWAMVAEGRAEAPTPENVVGTLFEVAKSGDVARLAGLCDPKGENDGDTKSICTLATDPAALPGFRQAFLEGALTGAAVVDQDRARVPFRFGPGAGQRVEEMELVRRDGRWYLLSF